MFEQSNLNQTITCHCISLLHQRTNGVLILGRGEKHVDLVRLVALQVADQTLERLKAAYFVFRHFS